MRYYREIFCALPSKLTNIHNTQTKAYDFENQFDKWKILFANIYKNMTDLVYSPEQIRNIIEISAGESDPFRAPGSGSSLNPETILKKLAELFIKS